MQDDLPMQNLLPVLTKKNVISTLCARWNLLDTTESYKLHTLIICFTIIIHCALNFTLNTYQNVHCHLIKKNKILIEASQFLNIDYKNVLSIFTCNFTAHAYKQHCKTTNQTMQIISTPYFSYTYKF